MIEVEISETVLFYDTDCGGVVSNIAYLRYVEKARTSLFAGLGMPAAEMMATGLFPAVVRTEIDYRSPARLGDEIRVVARLVAVEKVRAICEFRIVASAPGGEPRLVAAASQVVALIQLPEGRPRRMPPEWLRLME
jgi:4-hydroxybenzoyl-CoA thioesterase/acyl-CoA thioester hydrolase